VTGEKVPVTRKHWLRSYDLGQIERYDLGTPYTTVIDRVVGLFANNPTLAGQTLVIDHTGAGRPVYDMFVRARPRCNLRPITITAGQGFKQDDVGGWKVAKKDLVSVLQVLLQSRRLAVGERLPLAMTLVKELENFRVKITANANETFEAWREGQHDDLVLAVALAVWVSEKGTQEYWLR
jgi:hypothetical protein